MFELFPVVLALAMFLGGVAILVVLWWKTRDGDK